MKYRKKPVVVDAVRVRDALDCTETWVGDAFNKKLIHFKPLSDLLSVDTPRGTMAGRPDDWLIRGSKGELYICEADNFEDIYEPEQK